MNTTSPLAWIGLLLALLGSARGVRAGSDEVPTPWPLGGWRVVERGWGLSSKFRRLEVHPGGQSGDAVIIAFEADDQGVERVWGSARLDRPTAESAPARWFAAEWTEGTTSVLLQLRHDGDRLVALVRQRERERTAVAVEKVRQFLLEREPGETRLAAIPTAGRPAPDRFRRSTATAASAKAELFGLFVVGRDGTGVRPVALPDGFSRAAHPAWSPDGRWLAFTAFDATGRDPVIRLVASAGGPTTAVAAGIAPSWSHDGMRLAYVASGRPEYATDWNAPGRNDERIEAIRLNGPGAGEVEALTTGLWPRWSPTDDRLAFAARRDANWDVYVRAADGLGLTRLTDDPALDSRPVWAADGRALVFLSNRGNRWDLYRVAADGRAEAVRLTDHRRREEGADLSPDGRLVAFHDRSGRPDGQIFVLELAGGTVRPLLDVPNADRDPAWSPDGRSLAFVRRSPGASSPTTDRRP